MGEKNNTLFRTLAMLQIIPKEPGYKATSTIHTYLEEKGFKVTLRTVQRDLSALTNHFPLRRVDGEGEYRWCLCSTAADFKVGLDIPTALTFVLAKKYLLGLLPQIAIDQISAQFEASQQYLDKLPGNDYSDWTNRVKAVPSSRTLIPAVIKDGVWETVSKAVLEKFAIDVTYLNRKRNEVKEYTLHPQGIVVRNSVSYLVASANDYSNPLQFALHRIQIAVPSLKEFISLDGFDLNDYISRGELGYLLSNRNIELKARVKEDLAWTLSETPLSVNQKLEKLVDDWYMLTARIPDEQQTLRWLQGYGSAVDIIKPLDWREHIHQQAKQLLGIV